MLSYWSNITQSCQSCPNSSWTACGSKCYKVQSTSGSDLHSISSGITMCKNIGAELINAPTNQLQYQCILSLWSTYRVDSWVEEEQSNYY